jgi:hypothetical protein
MRESADQFRLGGALEEAAAKARHEPVQRTGALRLALAYLASRKKPGHQAHDWAFDLYWKSLTANRVQERWGKMNAALNGIYLGVGRKRELTVVSVFEKCAREVAGSSDESANAD